jgi:hypothetical protein
MGECVVTVWFPSHDRRSSGTSSWMAAAFGRFEAMMSSLGRATCGAVAGGLPHHHDLARGWSISKSFGRPIP